MRKLLIIIIVFITPLAANAQSRKYTNAINELRGMYKMSSYSLTQESLQLVSFFASAVVKEDMKELIDGIRLLKINKNTKASPDAFYNEANRIFKKAGFYQLDISKYTHDQNTTIFVERRLFALKEAHIIMRDNKGMVVSLFGRFKYRDIKKVIKRIEENGKEIF
ncbi:MAG: DUF4252 domain-containing protein [Bacteroidales bacterium]|nr:DUF4252 domain-containing protein [Bacteroidales bacterium]